MQKGSGARERNSNEQETSIFIAVKRPIAILALVGALLLWAAPERLSALDLIFPTPNEKLFEHPEHFYMKTARSGSDAWKGGTYGFSRNARRIGGETVHTRFHEGVDIAPTMRDKAGRPLDSVVSIDKGVVVYVNARSSASNYGKYVVVRHVWEGSPFYSLYAHLNEVWTDSGAAVEQGDPIGLLGYTGAGINRARAHLHFEIAMLVNWSFDTWYAGAYGDGKNFHGFYNGINLAGLNVARLYERYREDSSLSIRDFIAEEHEPFYRVRTPRAGRLDLLWRYPWLLEESAKASHRSWEITFDASGLPLGVVSVEEETESPSVVWAAESSVPYSYRTKSRLRGSTGSPSLSGSGRRFIDLLLAEPDSAIYAAELAAGAIVESPLDRASELAVARAKLREELKARQRERMAAAVDEKRRDPPTTDGLSRDDPFAQNDEDTLQVVEEVPLAEEERESPAFSIMHTRGQKFLWRLDGNRWTIELRPIELRADYQGDEIDDAGVDTLRVACPDCSDYGIAPPRLRRIDEVTWGIVLQVTDRRRLGSKIRQLLSTPLELPLLIAVDEETGRSVVKVEVRVERMKNSE